MDVDTTSKKGEHQKIIDDFGGDLTQFVPEAVALELEKKMNTKGECNK